MENFTPYSALLGGMLIGVSASLLLWMNGKIAGISGIFRGATTMQTSDRIWRVLFVAGLILGGWLWLRFAGSTFTPRSDFPLGALLLAGVFVGVGTTIGNGCTSGHGVCGIGRGSKRSIVATATFFGVALVTTFVVRHILGAAA